MRRWYEDVWSELPEGLDPPDFEARRAFALEEVGPGDRVLDLGCGDGPFLPALAQAGQSVVGADVAQAALDRAAARVSGTQLVRVEPEGPWPWPEGAFDVVWTSEVIEHVADTEAWMNEVRRVLAPGGRLLLTTPSVGPLRRVAAPPDPRGQHLRFYTGRTLRSLLRDMGFADVAVRRRGGVLYAKATR